MNASEDVLIGIGAFKVGSNPANMSKGKTNAELRARADISRQLQSIVKDMITDYTAGSELDESAALSFQENITQALSKAELKGAKTIEMQTDDNGLLWVVMEYSKSAAATDYSAAQAAAKLAVPAAAAFDALSRMDNAFDKAAGGGPVPVGD
jgi:purine-nucleoside phosphorylase